MSKLTKVQAFDREQRVRRMLAEGKTQAEIAAIIGVTRQAVSVFCRIHEIGPKGRAPGRPKKAKAAEKES